MRNRHNYDRFNTNRFIIWGFIIGMLVFFVSMFFGPWLMMDDKEIPNFYNIYVNDTYVGKVKEKQNIFWIKQTQRSKKRMEVLYIWTRATKTCLN